MSSERKGKKLCCLKGGPPSPLTVHVCGATLAFVLCVHILSALHAQLTSVHSVLRTTSSTLQLPRWSFRDREHGALSTRPPRRQFRGTVLGQSNGTRRRGHHPSEHGLVLVIESGNETTKQAQHASQQANGNAWRPTTTKAPDPEGTLATLSGRPCTRLKHGEKSEGVRECLLETLATWKGDLDGVDLRHLLQNLTAHQRQRWLARNLARFKILQSHGTSESFPSRMKCFFEARDDVACGDEKSFGGRSHFSDVRLRVDERDGNDTQTEFHEFPKEDFPRLGYLPQVSVDALQLLQRPGGDHRHDPSGSGRKKCEIRVFMTWIFPLALFGPREQLSLESVFRTYPFACVVILSRSLDSEIGLRYMKPFLDRGFRIIAASPDIPFLLKKTPALRWFKDLNKGNVDPGEISLTQNISNLLRLAALYKYGGVYLDSDIIMLRKFPALDHVIGSQSVDHLGKRWTRINNAVMIFPRRDPVLFKFIEEFALTFNGSKWGHNGPYLVTRVWRRLMNRRDYECSVLSPVAFYPVDWVHVGEFLKAPKTRSERTRHVAKMAKIQSNSYALHLWNKQSRELAVERGSVVDLIFRQRCVFCDETVLNAALQPQRRK